MSDLDRTVRCATLSRSQEAVSGEVKVIGIDEETFFDPGGIEAVICPT